MSMKNNYVQNKREIYKRKLKKKIGNCSRQYFYGILCQVKRIKIPWVIYLL